MVKMISGAEIRGVERMSKIIEEPKKKSPTLSTLTTQYNNNRKQAYDEQKKIEENMKKLIQKALTKIDLQEESEIDISSDEIWIDISLINYMPVSELTQLVHMLGVKEEDVKLDARQNIICLKIPMY